jgi:hypothetical protein
VIFYQRKLHEECHRDIHSMYSTRVPWGVRTMKSAEHAVPTSSIYSPTSPRRATLSQVHPAWDLAARLPLRRHRCQRFSTNEPRTQKRSAIAYCVSVPASSAVMIRSRRS